MPNLRTSAAVPSPFHAVDARAVDCMLTATRAIAAAMATISAATMQYWQHLRCGRGAGPPRLSHALLHVGCDEIFTKSNKRHLMAAF